MSRHTDKKLVRALNQSIQAFRKLISEKGNDFYETTASGVLVAGTSTITAPADLVDVMGLDITVNGERRSVFPATRGDRNDYQILAGALTGVPVSFRMSALATIELYPTPDSAYAYRLLYLPTGTDMTATYDANDALTASSSVFDGMAGWEDWIVYDTAVRIATRDAATNDNYELLVAELARIQARILTGRKRVRAGPLRRKDTRGRRLNAEATAKWRAS